MDLRKVRGKNTQQLGVIMGRVGSGFVYYDPAHSGLGHPVAIWGLKPKPTGLPIGYPLDLLIVYYIIIL